MAGPLTGKVAMVTGGSRGIGRGIALSLAHEGATVVVCARSDDSAASPYGSIEQTAQEARELGGEAVAMKLDVTNDDEVRQVVESIQRDFGHLDIVVNNAARMGQGGGDFWGSSPENLDAYYRTNVRAPYLITTLVGPHMEQIGGGAIINITSGGASLPRPPGPDWQLSPGRTYVGYGITKAALNRWVAGVAGELRLRNIAIVAVDPGRTVVERNIVNPIAGVDYTTANSPEVTGRAVAFICRDAMAYTGRVVESKALVDEHGLAMTGIVPRNAARG